LINTKKKQQRERFKNEAQRMKWSGIEETAVSVFFFFFFWLLVLFFFFFNYHTNTKPNTPVVFLPEV